MDRLKMVGKTLAQAVEPAAGALDFFRRADVADVLRAALEQELSNFIPALGVVGGDRVKLEVGVAASDQDDRDGVVGEDVEDGLGRLEEGDDPVDLARDDRRQEAPRHRRVVGLDRAEAALRAIELTCDRINEATDADVDLVAFTGITGPLTSALTQIASLGPGIKALVGFVGFVVALISLAALRNFGPVLFYVGLAIFAAVGLVIAGAIMGAVI